jgi:hypothetical protein
MKRLFKIFKIFLAIITVLLISGYIYFNQQFPKVIQAEEITIERTPERIERGKYIFYHAAAFILNAIFPSFPVRLNLVPRDREEINSVRNSGCPVIFMQGILHRTESAAGQTVKFSELLQKE